jgi:hypothetical protein
MALYKNGSVCAFEDFMVQLNQAEIDLLVSQDAIPSEMGPPPQLEPPKRQIGFHS